jgi:hypothetical protein
LARRCSRVSCNSSSMLPRMKDCQARMTWSSPTPGGLRSLASPHSLLSKELCLDCLTRLSWSSKRSQRFGRALRLFRDCRRAQSLSDPADLVLQNPADALRAKFLRHAIELPQRVFHSRRSLQRSPFQGTYASSASQIFRHSRIALISETMFEVFTRVGPDNSLERLTERSVGLVTDRPSDVY